MDVREACCQRGSVDDSYERQKRYYDLRAQEYDATSWEAMDPRRREEVVRIAEVIAALPPARTLDVACGTAFLSRHLRGDLTLLDASNEMLAIAAARLPNALRAGRRHVLTVP
jgi:ubiquinone/menaquinone biosynthesis C-methylase UbiE